MVRYCSKHVVRPDTQGYLEMYTTRKDKTWQTENDVKKNCPDGPNGKQISIGAGASFGDGKDPVEE